MKSGAEIKVGVVVLAALVVLGVIAYYFVGLYAARIGYPLDVIFDRAEVRPGDNVVMAGVSVGRVEAVELTEANRALVRLRITPGVEMRRGYSVHIVPGTLLGEKFVEIRPVPLAQAGEVLDPGAQVIGEPYVRIEDLVADAQNLLARLTEAVESVTGLVKDERVRAGAQGAIRELAQAARDMGSLARTLKAMAAETRPQLRALLANVDGVTADLRATSAALSRTASETEIPHELEEAARRLRSVTERVDDIAAQFQAMTKDPEMKELATAAVRDLRDTSDSVRQAGEEIRAAAADARVTAAAIAEASRDAPEITANVREASANIRDASAEIKDIAHEARASIAEVTGPAADAAQAIRKIPRVSANLSVGSQYLTREDRWWVDANLDLSGEGGLVRLGVADLGETDRLNLQLGQDLGPGRIRYGVVESEVGLAYDWALAPWLTLTAEVFDPNDLRANVLGYWGLGGTLEDVSVVAGYRGAGGEGSAAIGVRVER